MLSRSLVPVFVATLCLVTGCEDSEPASPLADSPAFAQVPAAGNGNKLVFPIDEDLPSFDCGGGEILNAHLSGWIQVRFFTQPSNRNVELAVFLTVITFTNSAGETFVFQEHGPDRVYVDDGNFLVAFVGRLGGAGFIGRLVINLNTDEVVFIAGKDIPDAFTLACEALT